MGIHTASVSGIHNLSVSIVPPQDSGVQAGTVAAWSKNKKWSGTNSYCNLRVSLREVQLLNGKLKRGNFLHVDAEKTEIPRRHAVPHARGDEP